MKAPTLALALAVAISSTACDAPADTRGAVDFRQDFDALYLLESDADISVDYFAKIVAACPSKAPLTLTFTRYHKDATGAPLQVIGLGFSAMADDEWADCYEAIMLKLGAHP